MRINLIVGVAGLLLGCGDPPAPVGERAAPPAPEPWRARYAELQRVIQIGMTEAEVLRVAGEPSRSKTFVGAEATTVWEYDMGAGARFKVRFDQSNRVARAEFNTQVKVQ